ncbi:hypothetical protein NEFER03_1722 [Nematocida sp. LUAm3]|nr:hypothetical protein NEFER03_1722 [Nematocida sp. LUAm3]KAI5175712.1 hypothetical protein NEFER02_1599 [Nematocida sp. LUAm2]KAI5178618.1 hypothetical protein NEFER01_1754 [Nematocida sp. LUAm1]
MEKKKCKEIFEENGATVQSGIKYGADYLVYLDDPKKVHSSFSLSTVFPVTLTHLSALVRVSSSTKKATVIYTGEETVPFIVFQRFFTSNSSSKKEKVSSSDSKSDETVLRSYHN